MKVSRREFIRDGVAAFTLSFAAPAFLADIADYMGLRTPATATWMYPENFINSLRDLNGGRQEITLAASH